MDSLKGFLIFLVVLGHVLELNTDAPGVMPVRNIIYSFHMPLFIVVSGYFSQISDPRKYIRGILDLAVVYILYTIYHVLISGSGIGFTLDFLRCFLYPQFVIWYIFTLIAYRLFILAVHRGIDAHFFGYFALSAVLALLVGFAPGHQDFLSFSRLFVFFPFFLLGFGYRRYFVDRQDVRIPRALRCLVPAVARAFRFRNRAAVVSAVIVIALVSAWMWPKQMVTTFYYTSGYYLDGHFSLTMVMVRLAGLAISAVMCYAVTRIRVEWGVLEALGRKSLYVYIYHALFYCLCRRLGALDWGLGMAAMLALAVAITAASYLLGCTRVGRWIVAPKLSWRR